MTDMEKVRQGVWQCLLDNTEEEYETQCLDCPYYSEGITLKECKTQLRKDFTELLKSKPQIVLCKDCKHILPKGFCHKHSRRVPDDWFCADGERK